MGGAGSSRNALTFSGNEDLGNGNSAFFTLNHRFSIQNGTQNGQNNTTAGRASADTAAQFYRNAFVGLKNNSVGDVRFGRILFPNQDMNGGYEAWAGGDGAGNVHSDGRGGNPAQAGLRNNEAIYLRSASFGGLVVEAAHGRKTGGTTQIQGNPAPANTSTNTVSPTGFGVSFAFGPGKLGVSTDKNNNDKKTTGVYGKYNFGFAELFAQYEKSDTNATNTGSNAQKDKRVTISTRVPVGDFTIKAGYRVMNRGDLAGSAKKVGVGLEYNLSKRTQIYTSIGKTTGSDTEVRNDAAATLAQGDTARKPVADIGVWHRF
jgi:predicted porin